MKPFILSTMLYKQHMGDIFEVYNVFTVNIKEPKILTFASSKSHEFIFLRHIKYLCCFTSTTKINKPFERTGQGQTDIRLPTTVEGYQTGLEWDDSSPNLTQYPLAHLYRIKSLKKKFLWEHKLSFTLQARRPWNCNTFFSRLSTLVAHLTMRGEEFQWQTLSGRKWPYKKTSVSKERSKCDNWLLKLTVGNSTPTAGNKPINSKTLKTETEMPFWG